MKLSESLVDAVLQETVRESFELLAFAEVTDWEEPGSRPVEMDGYIGARIQIRKPVSGMLSLFLDRESCAGLAGAVGGEVFSDSSRETEILRDFMNELVNTIAGRFAAALAGEAKMTGLGLPAAIEEWEGEGWGRGIGFHVDEKQAFLFVEGI